MNQRIYIQRLAIIKPITLWECVMCPVHLIDNKEFNKKQDMLYIEYKKQQRLINEEEQNYWHKLPSDEFYIKLKEQCGGSREELARFVGHPNWIAKCAKRMNMDESDYIDLLYNCNVI